MKSKIIFLLIIILASILRFYRLGTIPPGLYSDEAAFGYNAYSILQTEKDEYGVRFPILLKSFGEYKDALYAYYLIPFIAIFGLTIEAVRSASALLGIGIVILCFFLVFEIFKNYRLAFLTAFFASVSPFFLQFQRVQHESDLSLFLILLGVLFFLKARKHNKLLFGSFFFFGISLYAHHDAKIITPVLILVLIFTYRRFFLKVKNISFISFFLFICLVLPLFASSDWKNSLSRPLNVSILTDSGVSSKINQNRLIARQSHGELSSLYFNKPVQIIEKISQNYLSHFSPDFLFFQGDPVKIYQTVDTGILYYFDILLICAGIYYFIKNGNLFKPILIGLLIIGPIAGGLTRYVPSASRTLLFALPLIMLSAIGISGLSKLRKKNSLYFTLFVCLIFCIVSNMSLYLYRYYVITPFVYAKEWHYGTKDVLSYVSDHQNQYDRIWFSKNVWGYIYTLFYLKYPPGIYQQKDHLGLLNEYGFGWVENFDKYYFDTLPQNMKTVKSTLFIGAPEEFPADIKPLKIIYYPDNSSAFYIADRNSFLK